MFSDNYRVKQQHQLGLFSTAPEGDRRALQIQALLLG